MLSSAVNFQQMQTPNRGHTYYSVSERIDIHFTGCSKAVAGHADLLSLLRHKLKYFPTYLAAACGYSITLYDTKTWEKTESLSGDLFAVLNSNELVLVSSATDSFDIWNISQKRVTRTINVPFQISRAFENFLTNNLLVCRTETELYVINLLTENIQTVKFEEEVNRCCCRENIYLTCSKTGVISVWNLTTLARIKTLSHSEPLLFMGFWYENLVLSSNEKTIILDIDTGNIVNTIPYAILFTQQHGEKIAVVESRELEGFSINVWREDKHLFKLALQFHSFSTFSPFRITGSQLIFLQDDFQTSHMHIFDLNSGTKIKVIEAKCERINT